MFVLNLVDFASREAREKFYDVFGFEAPAEYVVDEDFETFKVELKDQIFEYLAFLDIYNIEAYLTISHTETHRVRKLDSEQDFEFFVDESLRIQELAPEEIPESGNFWADLVGDLDDGVLTRSPLSNPYDIDDVQYMDEEPGVDLELPISAGSENLDIDYSYRKERLALMNRLAKFGAAFPYLNENDLLRDFERLSKIDEVEDADLINFLKFGYDEFKSGAKATGSAIKSGLERHAENKSKKREEQAKNAEKVAKVTDDVIEILTKARTRGDDEITRAYGRVAQIQKIDKKQAERLKEKIRQRNARLPA